MSNVRIIHGAAFYDKEKLVEGLPPQNKRSWLPWVKEKLEERKILCEVPLMPRNWKPNYQDWKKEFEKLRVDEESILVGHSAGGAFLTRWLGETGSKIKKLILVAPAKICPDFYEDYFKEFYNFEINENIKQNIGKVIIFISNDNKNIIDSAKIYHEKLEGDFIELPNKGHFIKKEFPELLEKILE